MTTDNNDQNESYSKDLVKLNLMINPDDPNEMYATGGDLNEGPEGADVGYKGFDALKKMISPTIKSIYTITTLHDIYTVRCVGYFFDAKTALEVVLDNAGDIAELAYYPHCVIEEIKPGIYNYSRTEMWFEWDYDNECFVKIDEKPETYKNMGGFAFG